MVESVSPEDAWDRLHSDSHVAIIDIREPLDYTRGHIRKCTHIPRGLLEFRLPDVVPNTSVTVILCDQHGERAPLDAQWLTMLGYEAVTYIEGGMEAWMAAGLEIIEAERGVYRTAFNYPSKEFGEKIQVESSLEQITPEELKSLRDSGTDAVTVVDIRTPPEHQRGTIPGAVNIEGVDIGLYLDRIRTDNEPVVMHCTGRTRSIIATATLEKLGTENVYELENGTRGWELAGYDLERGSDRHLGNLALDDDDRDTIRSRIDTLVEDHDIPMVSRETVQELLDDEAEVVYQVDVRTLDEFESGHIPNSLAIPGGQAIQKADEHFAVRTGTIVFISKDSIRSSIVAYWFSEMGYPNVAILEGGIDGWQDAGCPLEKGQQESQPLNPTAVERTKSTISPSVVLGSLGDGDATVVNIDTSEQFAGGHLPNTSWVSRYQLEDWLNKRGMDADKPLILTCRDGTRSIYAAAMIQDVLGFENVHVLEGGTTGWDEADLPLETGTEGMVHEPRDDVPGPEEQGDWAKRAYLEWEEELGTLFT